MKLEYLKRQMTRFGKADRSWVTCPAFVPQAASNCSCWPSLIVGLSRGWFSASLMWWDWIWEDREEGATVRIVTSSSSLAKQKNTWLWSQKIESSSSTCAF